MSICAGCLKFDECQVTKGFGQPVCKEFEIDSCNSDCQNCKDSVTVIRGDEEYITGCKISKE